MIRSLQGAEMQVSAALPPREWKQPGESALAHGGKAICQRLRCAKFPVQIVAEMRHGGVQ